MNTTINTTGELSATIRGLARNYPGTTPHRIGRALLHLAIEIVQSDPSLLRDQLLKFTPSSERGDS